MAAALLRSNSTTSATITNCAFSVARNARLGGISPAICAPSAAPFDWEWARSSGKGKLFSWTTATQPMLPQFKDAIPYSPVVVELEEGVRIVTWLTDVKPDELALDMPLEVVFDDVTPTVTLPKFRRAA